MRRLRIVVAGGGRAAQLLHLPHLLTERERFEVLAIADPAPAVRAQVSARLGSEIRVVPAVEDLLELPADALLCAAPIPFHAQVVADALAADLHVFCEKPVAFTLEQHDDLIDARDRASRIVQVGYMKRFDPGYRRLLELLPDGSEGLVHLGIEVDDPQDAPFVSHPIERDPQILGRVRELEAEQIGADLDETPDEDGYHAYRHGYLSSLVHDVNLVHGILTALGHPLPLRPVDAAFWAGGRAVSLAFALDAGGRFDARHVAMPAIPSYRERLRLLFRDRILELSFPSPYLPCRPARLVEQYGTGGVGLATTVHHVSFADRVRLQWLAFHSSVADNAPVENTLEDARLDLQTLQAARRLAAGTSGERREPRPPVVSAAV